MESVALSFSRGFEKDHNIRNILKGEWVDLYDEKGRKLPGIRGKSGTVIKRANGEELGADMVEMEQGSKFPLHTHDGDHILYVMLDSGRGGVVVDGVTHIVEPGDTISIPGELAHGVTTLEDEPINLRFLAIGVPHKHVSATDRMSYADEEEAEKYMAEAQQKFED